MNQSKCDKNDTQHYRREQLPLQFCLHSRTLNWNSGMWLQSHYRGTLQGRVQQLTSRIGWTIGNLGRIRTIVAYVRQVSCWTTFMLSSRTQWQWLPAGDTLRCVLPAGNRCHFVLLDEDESCQTADLANIGRPNRRPAIQLVSCWTRHRPLVLSVLGFY